MESQAVTLAASRFVPIAIGFFGLGTGYFIWGGQALFGFPKTSTEVNKTLGIWGFWMPGFMQFVTGIWLMYCTYAITVNLALGARAWVSVEQCEFRGSELSSPSQSTDNSVAIVQLRRV